MLTFDGSLPKQKDTYYFRSEKGHKCLVYVAKSLIKSMQKSLSEKDKTVVEGK